ncbi:hypothetical protein Hanom_Chr06g00491611 [Helianthus anomalus]
MLPSKSNFASPKLPRIILTLCNMLQDIMFQHQARFHSIFNQLTYQNLENRTLINSTQF